MGFKCAWCMRNIKPDEPIYKVGAKIIDGIDVKDEGKIT